MKPSNSKLDINTFSPHLFWDVDRTKIDLDKNKKLIVHRVLEYGLLSDWISLNKQLEIQEISIIATELKDLDGRALSFISLISKTPKDKFLCYTTNRSRPQHWNF